MIEIISPQEPTSFFARRKERKQNKQFAAQFKNRHDYSMALWDQFWPVSPWTLHRLELLERLPVAPRGFEELKRRIFEA